MTYGKRGKPSPYPFEMVEYARRLRGYGFSYREIADECQHKFGFPVPWRTVADWVQYATRMSA